jgi:hypothetical protein
MDHQSASILIGSLGVSLLLLAFFLNLFKFLRSERYRSDELTPPLLR